MDNVLTLITQGALVLIAVLTLVDFLRRRDRARFDIALMFASLAAIVVTQGLTSVFHLDAPWLGTIGALALMAQPYLLLRLVLHFRALSPVVHAIAAAGLAFSWVVLLAVPAPLPLPATLVIVLYFVYVESYAAYAFVRGALTTGGVTHWRLLFAAAGSGFLALVILLAGAGAAVPAIAPIVGSASGLVGLLAGLSYYIGFAPPGWLRRAWQLSEMHRFLRETSERAIDDRADLVVRRLGPTAIHVTGGSATAVALWFEDEQKLVIRAVEGPLPVPTVVDLDDPGLGSAWRERESRVVRRRDELGPASAQLMTYADAEALLIVPIATAEHMRGLLLVFLRHNSLFLTDELDLLGLLAEQSAIALDTAALFAEQRALLSQLRRSNAELERASRLKSEFLANMSHELRTPLNAIIGFSDLLLDVPEEGYDASTQTTYLETIHSSGTHLLALINDVLDLSKVEAGKMELHPEPFALDDAIAHVFTTIDPLAARKRIELVARVAGAGIIVADMGKVKQILYNLLSNAIKFTPEGGRVTVVTERFPDSVQLVVVDTGIGIAPEDQDRLFQEFQQLDSGPNRRYEGTGLGLALTKRFVELHGGRIWVESAVGEGSRFCISLPLRPHSSSEGLNGSSPAEGSLATSSAEQKDGPIILVVEDDPRAANLLSLYLGRGGYRTVVATDGAQALAKARELRPLAITLDLILPKLDGWEVLRALKHDEETRAIPVVVVSILDDDQLGYALGAVDYFVKPVDRRALLERLGRYTFATEVKEREVRVLVVDDDPTAVELFAGFLAPAGYRVVKAHGGAEAIRSAESEHPDIVLLDLMMPEVNGFDVVTALKASPKTRDIPILVITAKDLTEADKATLNGHVAAVLQKGALGREELLSWLDDMVRRLTAPDFHAGIAAPT